MTGRDALLQTIATIYTAPGNVAQWTATVREVTELVGGKASVYMLVNGESLSNEITAFHGFSEADVIAYQGPNGAAKDIRFHYMHNLIPGKVFREFEFVTDRAGWDACEWIQYQLKHLKVYWGMVAQISNHGLWRDFISINRLHERGPHTEAEKADLQAVLPHLARAAELHRVLASLEHRYHAVLAVLDKLLVGLILLDHKGRMVVANRSAREICESSGCISLCKDGSLQAYGGEHNAALQRLIQATRDTANASGCCDGGTLVLPRRSGGGPILLEVTPIRDDGLPDREGIQGTALFLMDPERSSMLSVNGIASIFQLTPAEHSVTDSLVNGRSLTEIAEQRGASVQTIRSQLKSIFSKTGANSQLELMRLAVKANPPIGD